jgi:hypothetical protein
MTTMTVTRALGLLAQSRMAVLLSTLFYAWGLHYAHVAYLYPEWEYYGFTLRSLGVPELLMLALLLVVGAMMLPVTLARASSIFVLLLYVVVYVPAVVITLSLDADRLAIYGPGLAMLAAGFSMACMGARARLPQASDEGIAFPDDHLPGHLFTAIVLVAWASCCIVLIVGYGSVMRLVGLADIYEQRAAGQNTSLLMGYVQTYFSNVLSPALIAAGLLKSRWSLVAIGAAGCVIMFMIAAQRTVILLPLVMIAVHYALARRSPVLRTSSFLLVFLGVIVLLAVAYQPDNVVASLTSLYLIFRTVGLPGLTFSQYTDLFGTDGYTWWSHVRGLGLLIPTPSSYLNDASWPSLGLLVGDRVYGNERMNANANLFSGDGMAAAGAFGVAFIGLVLGLWLSWLDRLSRGWNRRYVILVLIPVALSLTNGHFFTTLLSFGGLFWMLAFWLYKPGHAPGRA